ncbi:Manganese transporter smf1 [Rhizina undulata]
MNCPSRVDENASLEGHNQNPPFLAGDLTTQADLNNIANLANRDDVSNDSINRFVSSGNNDGLVGAVADYFTPTRDREKTNAAVLHSPGEGRDGVGNGADAGTADQRDLGDDGKGFTNAVWKVVGKATNVLRKYATFIGPGFLISVAYMDPGNYSTDIAAGATFKYAHLFVILLANFFAAFLQSLCIKLGSVTGLNLAENCREHFPKWLCLCLYFLAECAIVATDLAEVIGSAIALNILLKIPLVAGVAVTAVDVLVVLFFYRPNGAMRGLRAFEIFLSALVFGVVICFCVELSHIDNASAGEVMKGYLPSKAVATGNGLYLSCGIIGATVMPHSLYLGSGIVQPRLRDFDIKAGNYSPAESDETEKYRPSISAIRYTMNYCIADLVLSLFTAALFANSAILIVGGATLSGTPEAQNADLFGIYDLLQQNVSKVAGTIFALSLLFSGESAGIVATLAGQMISEGFLNWTMKPWLRRLIVRTVALAPCLVIAATVGRSGLSQMLNASQVALSILLPFVSAPLIYFTCRDQYMRVPVPATDGDSQNDGSEAQAGGYVDMSNSIFTTIAAVLLWSFLAGLNV